MLCAGDPWFDADFCKGDSGGKHLTLVNHRLLLRLKRYKIFVTFTKIILSYRLPDNNIQCGKGMYYNPNTIYYIYYMTSRILSNYLGSSKPR